MGQVNKHDGHGQGHASGLTPAMNEFFRKFAKKSSELVGSSWTFITVMSLIIIWAVTGLVFDFSDTWQLVMNTATSVLAFLIVCLIQNTQNRDAKALHLKLDELLRSVEGARTGLVDLENLSDEELKSLQQEFERLRAQHRATRVLDPEAVGQELKEREIRNK